MVEIRLRYLNTEAYFLKAVVNDEFIHILFCKVIKNLCLILFEISFFFILFYFCISNFILLFILPLYIMICNCALLKVFYLCQRLMRHMKL